MSRPFRDQARTLPPATAMQARSPSHFTSATNSAASVVSPATAVASMDAMKPGLSRPPAPASLSPRVQAEDMLGSRLGGHGGPDLAVSTLIRTDSHRHRLTAATPAPLAKTRGHARCIIARR